MAKSSTVLLSNPGMVLVATYFIIFAVNAVVLYAANLISPQHIVLGTMTIPPMWAILHSMGTLALINTLAVPFIHQIEKMKGRQLTTMEWMLKYFAINFLGLWVIARFSEQFGMGLSGWWVAAVLALVLDLVQGAAMMQLGKMQGR